MPDIIFQDYRNKLDVAYSYDPTDRREKLDTPDEVRRMLQGGSLGDYYDRVHCAVRLQFAAAVAWVE